LKKNRGGNIVTEVEFKIVAGYLKKFLKTIKCIGTAKETGTGFIMNDCVIEVKDDSLEVKGVGDARGIFVHNICHDVEVITPGLIPVGSISQNKDKEPLGLLDCVEDFSDKDVITVKFDGSQIYVVGDTSQWTLTTVGAGLIQSYKNALGFYEKAARWDGNNPIIANSIKWTNYANIPPASLPHIAKIAKKVASMTKQIVITVSLNSDGLYITTGSKISNRSLITDKVHVEEGKSLTSQFSHGVGYVFPYIGRCQLFMGPDSNGFIHMWIHTEESNFTRNYFIAQVPP